MSHPYRLILKIFVISLPSSLERRALVAQKLGERKLPFAFIDAVDGRVDRHPYLQRYDEKSFLVHRRRKAAPGELGCYVSHLLAWEKCVALGEPIVVLEDDFQLTPDFEAGLAYLERFADRVSFVRLEPLEKHTVLTSDKGERFSLVKQLDVGMCMTGYVITPRGAQRLLEHAATIRAPIELFMKYTFDHGELIHAIVPHGVYPTHEDSVIGIDVRNQREKGTLLGLKRFAYKTFYRFANLFTNLANGLRRF
jgi:glycosyl transferase family 25